MIEKTADIVNNSELIAEALNLIETIIPLNICRLYKLVPLREDPTGTFPSVVVGMTNLKNLEAEDVIKTILRAKRKGFILRPVKIEIEEYEKIVNEHLAEKIKLYTTTTFKDKNKDKESLDFNADIKEIEDLVLDTPEIAEANLGEIIRGAKEPPVISLCNKIIIKALTEKVSDIHVEPQEDRLRIRFRKDGMLSEGLESLPKRITPSVIARFKILASLDISERRVPQDGNLKRLFQGNVFDFRVSSIPGRYGEKIVLRILDSSSIKLGLDSLVTDAATLAKIREMIVKPYGLLLITGPTGSGKTTTLYSALAERNSGEVNISTVEEPIEYTLPGINQIEVIRDKGLDFATALRSLLRQDPDIILVGEIRDKETAKTAIEAALTGHLVLTTLHTNDAASAIARLTDIGVEPFLIASSLIGVIAQRLVRRVCSVCRVAYFPSDIEFTQYNLQVENKYFKAKKKATQTLGESSCVACSGAGYTGRVGVYEVMANNPEIRKCISDRVSTEDLKQVGIESGMKTLLQYSLELVSSGVTTLEEVGRVTLV